MKVDIILAAVFGFSVTVSAQACSRPQLSSCLSSRPTPTRQFPTQATPCTDVPCKCEQMSSEYGCYRMNCPNDPSAAQLNSQLAETCAPYFATKDTSGTATAYPVPPSRPSTTAPLLYAAVALPSSTTVLAISANPLDLQYATAMGGGDIGLMPTSTAVPDVGVGSGGGVVGGVAGGVGGVGTGNPTPGVPRKTVWNWLSGVVSRKGRKATGSRRVIRLN